MVSTESDLDAISGPATPSSVVTPTERASNRITEITRRDLRDRLHLSGLAWWGRLDETEFLSRIYKLEALPSHDRRYANAEGDIWQHRCNNSDWEDDWVFSDGRFGLDDGPDGTLLRFLAETIHPVVRSDAAEVDRLLAIYNDALRADGWELAPTTHISGRPVFGWQRKSDGAGIGPRQVRSVIDPLRTAYVDEQIQRMETAVSKDPALAIGQAKELLETICKAILEQRGAVVSPGLKVPQLVRATTKELGLMPDSIPDAAKGAQVIKVLLSNLSSVADGLAELRNLYGTGHGKSPSHAGLEPRHARLAITATAAVVTFLFETHLARQKAGA